MCKCVEKHLDEDLAKKYKKKFKISYEEALKMARMELENQYPPPPRPQSY